MDPKNVKLTTGQKILPLLKAINKEIPFSLMFASTVAIIVAIFGTGYVPEVSSIAAVDFVLRRIVVGTFLGAVTLGATGGLIASINDFLLPIINKIRKHYEDEALVVKKKVLEDAELEMLK